MRGLLTALPVPTFSACDTPVGILIAGDQAKGVVDGIVEDKMPGIDAGPNSGCVIDNASGSEIAETAGAGAGRATNSTVTLILGIAARCGHDQLFRRDRRSVWKFPV